jgi:mannose-6-phosphate isomerase-like protein (cupin superfamily)
MLQSRFIWPLLVWCRIASIVYSSSTANGAKDSTSFTFPDVKPDPYPVFVQVPEGAINKFLKTGYSTNGKYALVSATIPPGAGPAPHIHHWTDEWFYFPEGGLVIYSSNQTYPDPSQIPNGNQLPRTNMHRYHTKPGDLIYGPAFYVHGFRNEGNVSRTVILIWTPDKLSQFFFEVGQVVTDPCKMPPIDSVNKELFIYQAPKYGMNMSSYLDEYVASWNDDWQPALGMDAHGQELINLLSGESEESVSCPLLESYAECLQVSGVFIYSIGLFVIRALSAFY